MSVSLFVRPSERSHSPKPFLEYCEWRTIDESTVLKFLAELGSSSKRDRAARKRRTLSTSLSPTPENLEVRALLSTTAQAVMDLGIAYPGLSGQAPALAPVATPGVANPTPADTYVESLFLNLLGRQGGPLAYNSFANPLNQGTQSTSDVATTLLTSNEYRNLVTTNLFNDLLGRNPTTDPNFNQALAFGNNFLATQGSLEQLEATVLASQEYYNRAGGTNDAFVRAVFQNVLGRNVSPGYEAFVNGLNAGATRYDVAQAILNSQESNIREANQIVAGTLGTASPDVTSTYINALNQGVPNEQILLDATTSRLYANAIGINNLNFGPATTTPNEAYVSALGPILLGRQLTPAGVQYHAAPLNQGLTTRTAVASQFLNSAEGRNNTINGYYNRFLGRDATAANLQNANNLYGRGFRSEDIQAQILASPEYVNTVGGGTPQGYVNALFLDILGRPASPGSEVFVNALNNGARPVDVARAILFSTEGNQRFVQNVFLQLLGRNATQNEITGYGNILNQGQPRNNVIIALLASPEFASLL